MPGTRAVPARAVPVLGWLGCLGLLGVVVAAFLPWLRSGTAVRNSFSAVGVLQRVLGLSGAVDWAVDAWPFLPLLGAVVVVLAAARYWVPAAVLGLLPAVGAGLVSVKALGVSGQLNISVDRQGPIVTVLSSALASCAFAGVLIISALTRRERR